MLNSYAGISVTVARHGKLVKSRCYGCQALGGNETPVICPDIGHSTASDIASFAIGR